MGIPRRKVGWRSGRQKAGQAAFQPFWFSQFAFPDHDGTPAEFAKVAAVAGVAGDVGLELVAPEFAAGLGGGRALAVLVAMPEAAVDEGDGGMPGQHDVRGAGKVAAVETEAVAHAVQEGTDGQFGLGVRAADAGHEGGAGGGSEEVGHVKLALHKRIRVAERI